MLIKSRKKHSLTESDVTDYAVYARRREFIKKAGGTVAALGLGLPGLASAKLEIGAFEKDTNEILAEEITEAMHRRIKLTPKIIWVAPNTLERFVKKKKIFEKTYEK